MAEEKTPEKTVIPFTAKQERFGRSLIKKIGRMQVFLYRLSGGRLAKTFNGGPVALLTMTGRKSGKQRTIPLVYAEDGENVIMAASQGGMSTHPLWYKNIVAHPEVKIQRGATVMQMQVHVADENQEKELWPKLDAVYPEFSEYRQRAALVDRHIPLLLFKPI